MTRDVDAAKKYLAQCKYKPSDFTLELSWVGEVPLEERFALLMQANFAEIGIKSEIKKIPWALFSEQVTKPENTPNISQVFVNAVTGDPDTLLYGMYHSSAAGTWQSPEYLKDAKVDELLEKGRTASNESDRAEAYKALNNRLLELSPDIFAYDQTAVFATSKRVTAPTLSDPSKAFGLAGMNFTYRLIEMKQ
jgi:peptide/nickel transport system substrate-binding protein